MPHATKRVASPSESNKIDVFDEKEVEVIEERVVHKVFVEMPKGIFDGDGSDKKEKSTVEKKKSVGVVSTSQKATVGVKNNAEIGSVGLQFQEFLKAMKPGTKLKLCSNSLDITQEKGSNKQVLVEGEGKKKLTVL